MFCKHCGNQLPDNAKFCNSCGAPVEPATRSTVNGYAPRYTPDALPVEPAPSVGIVEAVVKCFQNAFNFSGRARRSEYWWVVLVFSIVSGVLGQFDNTFLPGLWSLIILIPNLSLSVRRLHDTGKSGWYLLWNLLPLIGSIMVLVHLASDSDPNTNAYGPNPKFNP